jgi:hypothetical protein
MKTKPTKLEKQLYDAIEFMICQLYADGINEWSEKRAFKVMGDFNDKYGGRHDGKWLKDPTGNLLETIQGIIGNETYTP